jgi:hypothetical protein
MGDVSVNTPWACTAKLPVTVGMNTVVVDQCVTSSAWSIDPDVSNNPACFVNMADCDFFNCGHVADVYSCPGAFVLEADPPDACRRENWPQ